MGIYTEIGGEKYSLVDEEIMREIAEIYRKAKLYDARYECVYRRLFLYKMKE